jgi:hypothetical protein
LHEIRNRPYRPAFPHIQSGSLIRINLTFQIESGPWGERIPFHPNLDRPSAQYPDSLLAPAIEHCPQYKKAVAHPFLRNLLSIWRVSGSDENDQSDCKDFLRRVGI